MGYQLSSVAGLESDSVPYLVHPACFDFFPCLLEDVMQVLANTLEPTLAVDRETH